ncbi:MAG: DUF488 domain-containing protein [Steroidobacteraceae bacterium]
MTRRRLQILTIGYEGASLADFLATLKTAGVQLLLDIRELPISRRKGFSKSALSAALIETGIEYSHERALGSPREIRYRLREDGDLARFFSDFREYLATQRTLLDTLARTTTGAVALLCYERNHAECHRSVVADALARRAQSTVRHLTVPHPDGYQQKPHPSRPHPRQSLPATE